MSDCSCKKCLDMGWYLKVDENGHEWAYPCACKDDQRRGIFHKKEEKKKWTFEIRGENPPARRYK